MCEGGRWQPIFSDHVQTGSTKMAPGTAERLRQRILQSSDIKYGHQSDFIRYFYIHYVHVHLHTIILQRGEGEL